MKKTEVPQDASSLKNFTKEVCYAVDEKGNYATNLSTGWEVKTTALDITWNDINKRAEAAKQQALKGEVSPLLYFIEIKVMDYATLAAYTGFWQWQIKRHLKPSVFNGLSDKKLQKYADVFDVSIDNLKKMNLNES
ncbi:MAG TPA: hypothetical protein VN698_01045 [Bacteroidia bacterium]|nr:hypothetical protein [Bacteroidia bacterium]